MQCDWILVPAGTELPLLGHSAHLHRAQATENKRGPFYQVKIAIKILKLNLHCLTLS